VVSLCAVQSATCSGCLRPLYAGRGGRILRTVLMGAPVPLVERGRHVAVSASVTAAAVVPASVIPAPVPPAMAAPEDEAQEQEPEQEREEEPESPGVPVMGIGIDAGGG